MSIEQFSADALRRFNERHEKADSLLFNTAGFYFDRTIRRFIVEVRAHIVAEFKTVAEVRAFSAMHNERLT